MMSTLPCDAEIDQLLDVRVVHVVHDGRNLYLRVDLCNLPLGRLGLGDRVLHVILVEEHLPLEVGHLDEVAVDDDDVPHARAGEHVGDDGAERAAADDQGGGVEQLLLRVFTEAGQEGLTVIAGKIVHVQWRFRFKNNQQLKQPK